MESNKKLESAIIGILSAIDDDDIVPLWNSFCSETSQTGRSVYSSDDFNEIRSCTQSVRYFV